MDNQTKMIWINDFIFRKHFIIISKWFDKSLTQEEINQLSHCKKGKFLVKSDTLVIFQSDNSKMLWIFITFL